LNIFKLSEPIIDIQIKRANIANDSGIYNFYFLFILRLSVIWWNYIIITIFGNSCFSILISLVLRNACWMLRQQKIVVLNFVLFLGIWHKLLWAFWLFHYVISRNILFKVLPNTDIIFIFIVTEIIIEFVYFYVHCVYLFDIMLVNFT